MIVIEDSMILIFLAKLGLVKETKDMFGVVVISKEVEKETTADPGTHPDAAMIRESISNDFVEVREVRNANKVGETMKKFGLGKGEAEKIQLYFQERADLLLCDDKKARKVADILGANLLGTPELIIQLHRRGFIHAEKARDCILKLEEIGWFKPSIIFHALKEIGD